MNLNWLQSILYGLIEGISNFLPISSKAHQDIALVLFGANSHDPVRNLIVHITLLCTVYFACRPMFEQLQRVTRQRRSRNQDGFSSRYRLDLRLVKTATLPLLAGIIVLSYIFTGISGNLMVISGLLLLNGIFLFMPGRMMQGNKDARSMTQFDAFLIGLGGCLGALPGFSGVGCVTGVSISRGADRQQSLNWAFILSAPAFFVLSVLDIIQIFSTDSIPFLHSFLTYLLSGLGAFCGGYVGIRLARLFMVRTGFSGFAYYSWGAALLCFLLYLFAV